MTHGRIANLRELMLEAQLHARDIATMLDVSEVTVYGWMRGDCCPATARSIELLARNLGVLHIVPFSYLPDRHSGFFILPNTPGSNIYQLGRRKSLVARLFDTLFKRNT